MNWKAVSTLMLCFSLALAFTCTSIKAQVQTDDTETFFDSKIPGMRIQVNATSATLPTGNITFDLSLVPIGSAQIKIVLINLTMYCFKNGTDKIKVYTNTLRNFELIATKICSDSFCVPEQVWGVAYGEITLSYNVIVTEEFGTHEYVFQDIVLGFTMTRIENIYLRSIEEQLANLRYAINDLNQTFRNCFGKNLTINDLLYLNETIWQLKQEYESLKGVKGELDNTRTTVIFLAVAAIFFIVTTAYLVLRKPKTYW